MTKKNIIYLLIVLLFIPFECNALAVNPYYEKYLNAAWKARQNKDFTKAGKYYICAARLNRKSSDASVGLLYTYIESDDFKKAETLADKLLKKYPANMWIRKGAAWTFYNRKRYNDAIHQYAYLLTKYPEDNDIQLGLGLSLYFAGRKREAKKACRECLDHFGKKDERIRLCLGKDEEQWFFTPGLYLSYTDFSDSFSKGFSKSVTTGLEVYHASGIGFYLQGTGMAYTQKNTDKTYLQSALNAAIFYSDPELSLWFNRTRLDGDFEDDAPSDIYTVALSTRSGDFYFGFAGSKGYYNYFETSQYKPELGIYLGDFFLIKLGVVTQKNYIESPLALIETKTRYSTELSVAATFKHLSLNLAGYRGKRWYTVEDKGLNIWNTDEEFEWGSKLDFSYKLKHFSPYISVRVDKTIQQHGIENDFYTTGITTGIMINF